MFLNQIKEFSLKRILKKSFQNLNNIQNTNPIKSVGLLIDESLFKSKNDLIKELIAQGFKKENLKVLIFNDKINANEVFAYPTFNLKNIDLSGNFTENVVKDFINKNCFYYFKLIEAV